MESCAKVKMIGIDSDRGEACNDSVRSAGFPRPGFRAAKFLRFSFAFALAMVVTDESGGLAMVEADKSTEADLWRRRITG